MWKHGTNCIYYNFLCGFVAIHCYWHFLDVGYVSIWFHIMLTHSKPILIAFEHVFTWGPTFLFHFTQIRNLVKFLWIWEFGILGILQSDNLRIWGLGNWWYENMTVWTLKVDVCILKFEVLSFKFEIWNLEFLFEILKFEVWSLTFDVWSLKFGVLGFTFEACSLKFEVLSLHFEVWSL